MTTQIKLIDLRCAVLGGGGFIGTNLCRALSNQVSYVCGFGRRQCFPEAMQMVKWVTGNFHNSDSLSPVLEGCNTVFHLVNNSTPAGSNNDKIADLESNVISTLRLLEACREAKVSKIIFISSGGTVYGIPKLIPTPETSSTDPITSYGICKLTVEKYLYLYKYYHGIDYTVLRVANPFGPYQIAHRNQGAIAAFMHKVINNQSVEVWGNGSIVRDYIYIDDVINAIIQAATYTGASNIFNIGSGEGKNLIEIIDSLEKATKKKVSTIFKPGRAVDVPINILDIELAKKELDWHPQCSLENGLKKTFEWMQNYQEILAKE